MIEFVTANVGLTVTLALILLYPLAMRLLAEWAQPYRLELADVGKELLSSHHVPEELKKMVSSLIDDAFDWRFMAIGAVVVPAYIIATVLGCSRPVATDIHDKEARKKFSRFLDLYLRATAAANPICAVVIGLEVGVLVAIAFPFGLLAVLRTALSNALFATDRRLKHS